MNDLAFVTGAAIDQIDDNQIELTVEIFTPQGMGGGMMGSQSQSGGSQSSYTSSAIGANIADAMSHLQEKMSRKIFWGHSEIYLFGEEAARNGIEDDIDFLLRAPQPRERAYIYAVKGKAKRIFQMHPVLERTTAEALREMSRSRVSISVTLAELSMMLTGDTDAVAIPWIRDLMPFRKQQTTRQAGYSVGTAVFRKDKLAGVLDDTTSGGVLWLRNEIRHAVVTVKPVGFPGAVSLWRVSSQTKLKPVIQNGKWSMKVMINAEFNVLQNDTNFDLSNNNEAVRAIEEAANRQIESQIRQALNLAQIKWNADIFDFAGKFHRKYPQAWKKRRDEWDTLFPQIKVSIVTDSKLVRPGRSNVKSDIVKEQ